MEATVATSKVPVIAFPAQTSALLLTISAEQISKYAEITSLVSGLEAQQKELRSELLQLHAAGAEQEETSPYLLNFVEQEREFQQITSISLSSETVTVQREKFATEALPQSEPSDEMQRRTR
jgi:hypothetical protein